MNWKGMKGFVLLLSITLVFPSSSVYATIQKSSQKHKTSTTQKFSSRDLHSGLTAIPSSELYENEEAKHHEHSTTESKETPLIRLKRIKRQAEKTSSMVQHSLSNNAKFRTPVHPDPEILKMNDKSYMASTRPAHAPPPSDRRKSPSHPTAFRDRDSIASMVQSEMNRKKEQSNRKMTYRTKGQSNKLTMKKTNEISEPIHHHVTGTGSYIHHRNEQNKLENAAEAAFRQRTHRKNKHKKLRNDLDLKGRSGAGSQSVLSAHPRPPGSVEMAYRGQDNRYHDVRGVRGHGRVTVPGQGGGATKHRARRGQRSETAAVENGGGQGQKVRAELEHIKRMQRDLMKEISHLDHMKKKKKKKMQRSASSSSSPSSIGQLNHRQSIAKVKRK